MNEKRSDATRLRLICKGASAVVPTHGSISTLSRATAVEVETSVDRAPTPALPVAAFDHGGLAAGDDDVRFTQLLDQAAFPQGPSP